MTAERKYIIGGSYSREQVGEVHVLEGRVVAEGYTEEGQVSVPRGQLHLSILACRHCFAYLAFARRRLRKGS